jgi:HEAT repeat protein
VRALLFLASLIAGCGDSDPRVPVVEPEPPPPEKQPGATRPADPPCEQGIVARMRAGGEDASEAARASAETCVVRSEELPALLELVRSEATPYGIRRIAARGLARSGPAERTVPILIELGDQDALALAGPEALPPIMAALQREDDQGLFVALTMIVSRHPRTPEARRALVVLLPYINVEEGGRGYFATPAAAAFGPELPGLLIEHLHGSDTERRVHAARALGGISDLNPEERATVIAALVPAATDPDEEVRTAAAASLQRVRERSGATPR